MITYSCKLQCPKCEKEYYERRLKPYKYKIRKTCSDCRKPHIRACGGTEDKSCKTCKFYNENHPHAYLFWGKCGKGYESDNMEDESFGLVYSGDVCNEHTDKT